jgi:Bacterial Ig-like domain
VIALVGPASTTLSIPYRVYLGGSESLKTPGVEKIIITGGSATDMRKTSSTTFTFLVTPNFDVTDKVVVQVEADAVEDLAGNKNLDASNEWVTYLMKDDSATNTLATSTELQELISSLDNILPSAGVNDCSAVASVNVNDYTNKCYGRVTMVGNGGVSGGGGGGSNFIGDLMTGLLKGWAVSVLLGKGGIGGLFGGFSGLFGNGAAGAVSSALDSGGFASVMGFCMCNESPFKGSPTIGLLGWGVSGRVLMMANVNPAGGPYLGKVLPKPPGVCGMLQTPKGCQNPFADSTGLPVVGFLPAPPIFGWTLGGGL